MAKFVNSFALLDDEEDDNVEILVNRIVKKVDDSLMLMQNQNQSSEFVHNGSGGMKGSRGRRDGSRGNGNIWNDDVQGMGFGDENVCANDNAGWEDASKSLRKGYVNSNSSVGDVHGQRRYRNDNWNCVGEQRGYGDQGHDIGAADGKKRYRNGNQSYGGERRGYENGATDGRRQYRNGRRTNDGERRFSEGRVRHNDANSSEQLSRKGDVYQDSKFGGEGRKYRTENRNYSGESVGNGGNKERSRQEYRTGSGEWKDNSNADDGHVEADHVNGSGGDADIVSEASKAAESEEQNTSEEVAGEITEPKEETEEQKKRREYELRKKEEEMKEAALMTLDQYEKLRLEKKKGLESLKTEVRKVSVDKEFEGMQLIKKKPDVSDDIQDKPKMKVGLRKQASECSKTENNRDAIKSEANDNDGKLTLEVHDIFKPAYRPQKVGGRGQGRGDQSGYRNQRSSNDGSQAKSDATSQKPASASVPARAHAPAPACRRMRIPTARDFPDLGANPLTPAPVKRST